VGAQETEVSPRRSQKRSLEADVQRLSRLDYGQKKYFLLPENIISGRHNRSIEPGSRLDEKKKVQLLASKSDDPGNTVQVVNHTPTFRKTFPLSRYSVEHDLSSPNLK
jgi:hypothetical protein